MTPNTNTRHAATGSTRHMSAQRSAATCHTLATPRRASAVLSAQELRRIVCDMVD